MYEACLEFPEGRYGWCVELHVFVVWWHVKLSASFERIYYNSLDYIGVGWKPQSSPQLILTCQFLTRLFLAENFEILQLEVLKCPGYKPHAFWLTNIWQIYIYIVLLTAEAFFKVKKKLSLRDNHMKRMLCLFGRKYSILESHNSFYFAVINLYIGTNPSNFARTCCLLPSSLKCRQACRKGKPEDLRKNCPEVEEVHAYWECPINFASLASLVSFFIQILCRCFKGNLCMPWPTKWFLFSCTVLGILLTTYQY